jgi:hypothetical protein
MAKPKKPKNQVVATDANYSALVSGIAALLGHARRSSARTVNGILTATYWEIGKRIVEFEQGGQARAEYGEAVLRRLAQDLTARCGRGFSRQNLQLMRGFYLGWQICQTPSGIFQARAAAIATDAATAPAAMADLLSFAAAFPLPWSQYVVSVRPTPVALCGGRWADGDRGGGIKVRLCNQGTEPGAAAEAAALLAAT